MEISKELLILLNKLLECWQDSNILAGKYLCCSVKYTKEKGEAKTEEKRENGLHAQSEVNN